MKSKKERIELREIAISSKLHGCSFYEILHCIAKLVIENEDLKKQIKDQEN